MSPRLLRPSSWSTLILTVLVALGAATRARAAVRFWQQGDSLLASDNFNRSNATPIAGNWTSSTMNLSSNHVVPGRLGSTGDAYYSGITWPADQYSKAALSVTGTAGGGAGVGLLVTFPPRTGQRRIGGSPSGVSPGGPDDDAPEVYG